MDFFIMCLCLSHVIVASLISIYGQERDFLIVFKRFFIKKVKKENGEKEGALKSTLKHAHLHIRSERFSAL